MSEVISSFSTIGFIGLVALFLGIFLVLSGAGIVRVEKVTVTQGKNTLVFGILFLAIGSAFLIIDYPSFLESPLNENDPSNLTTNTPTPQENTDPSLIRFEIWVDSINDCHVIMNGSVEYEPKIEFQSGFTWEWGDGASGFGWFPQEHTYAESGNYRVAISTPLGDSRIYTVSVVCP